MELKKTPILYTRKEECCGCTACYAVCLKDAISMLQDEEGFVYPYIDKSKCVKCYKCVGVCSFKYTSKRSIIEIIRKILN